MCRVVGYWQTRNMLQGAVSTNGRCQCKKTMSGISISEARASTEKLIMIE